MSSYPGNDPGQPISQSSFMAAVGTALHPCQHRPPGCQLFPHLKCFSLFCCVEALKTKTREGTVPTRHRQGHIQRKVTFFSYFQSKLELTVNSSGRHFRQKLYLLTFTHTSVCVLSHTLMNGSSFLQPYYILNIGCIFRLVLCSLIKMSLSATNLQTFSPPSCILIQDEQKLFCIYTYIGYIYYYFI